MTALWGPSVTVTCDVWRQDFICSRQLSWPWGTHSLCLWCGHILSPMAYMCSLLLVVSAEQASILMFIQHWLEEWAEMWRGSLDLHEVVEPLLLRSWVETKWLCICHLVRTAPAKDQFLHTLATKVFWKKYKDITKYFWTLLRTVSFRIHRKGANTPETAGVLAPKHCYSIHIHSFTYGWLYILIWFWFVFMSSISIISTF